MEGHTWEVTSVAFAPDGATVASGSKDNTVRLWDVKAGKCFCAHVSQNSLPPPPINLHVIRSIEGIDWSHSRD